MRSITKTAMQVSLRLALSSGRSLPKLRLATAAAYPVPKQAAVRLGCCRARGVQELYDGVLPAFCAARPDWPCQIGAVNCALRGVRGVLGNAVAGSGFHLGILLPFGVAFFLGSLLEIAQD